uniref:AAA family ATPase n=1 Tax=Anoxybacillus sp. TaxID=1872573 RepID=UPI00261F0F98
MKEPLAYRMRPRTIDEVVGQDHIIGAHTALYRMIKNGYVPSLLFYGQPGVGKTSLAYAIAGTLQRPFYILNATTAGKKEIEEIVADARFHGNVILFID